MFNRITVNAFLKSVIATLAMVVVIMLSIGAWSSWTRLAAVTRIAVAADATGDIFTALHNLRVDRSYSNRDLNSDKQLTAISPELKQVRDADMPALRSALAKLENVDIPDGQKSVVRLREAIARL